MTQPKHANAAAKPVPKSGTDFFFTVLPIYPHTKHIHKSSDDWHSEQRCSAICSGVWTWRQTGQLASSHCAKHWLWKVWLHNMVKTVDMDSSIPEKKYWNVSVILDLERTYYRNDSKRPAISEPKQTLDEISRLLSGILCKQYTYLFTKNKSKQSYVWIDSIFEAQNICFGSEIAGLLESFL